MWFFKSHEIIFLLWLFKQGRPIFFFSQSTYAYDWHSFEKLSRICENPYESDQWM